MVKILRRLEAENDMDSISDYIAKNNPENAIQFLRLMNIQFNKIAHAPLIG